MVVLRVYIVSDCANSYLWSYVYVRTPLLNKWHAIAMCQKGYGGFMIRLLQMSIFGELTCAQ